MSKKAKARRLKPTEAMSKVRTLRTGARKLNLVAQSIRTRRTSPEGSRSWAYSPSFAISWA